MGPQVPCVSSSPWSPNAKWHFIIAPPIKVEARSFRLTPPRRIWAGFLPWPFASQASVIKTCWPPTSWRQGSVGHSFLGGQIPIGHAFWRRGSVFPFLFALGHISKVLTKWPLGHSSILEGRDSSEIPQLVCVFAGVGGLERGVCNLGSLSCPALERKYSSLCLVPVVSCSQLCLGDT